MVPPKKITGADPSVPPVHSGNPPPPPPRLKHDKDQVDPTKPKGIPPPRPTLPPQASASATPMPPRRHAPPIPHHAPPYTREEILARLTVDGKHMPHAEQRALARDLEQIDIFRRSDPCQDKNLDTLSIDDPRLGEPKEYMYRLLMLAKISTIAEHIPGGHKPRDTQMIPVLQFLDGKRRLSEIKTGQGKTLISAMTAIAQVKILKSEVHVVASTENLARSAPRETQTLFDACNVSVGFLDDQGGPFAVSYGTSFDFESAMLSDMDPRNKIKRISQGAAAVVAALHEALDALAHAVPAWKPACNLQKADHTKIDAFIARCRTLSDSSNPKVNSALNTLAVLSNRLHGRRFVMIDECDHHLIDQATARARMSDPDPDKETIKQFTEIIAAEVTAYYSEGKAHIRGAEKALHAKIQSLVERHISEDPLLRTRWETEHETWIKNALEVLDPNPNNEWRDGVSFVLQRPALDELMELTAAPALRKHLEKSLGTLASALEELGKRGGKASPIHTSANEKAIVTQLTAIAKILDGSDVKASLTAEQRSLAIRITELKDRITEIIRINDLIDRSTKATVPRTHVFEIMREPQVLYLDVATGQIIDKMKFSGMIHQFLEYRYCDGKIRTEPSMSLRVRSFSSYLATAQQVVGVSGTLGDRDPEVLHFLKKAWGFEETIGIPEFCASRLREEPAIKCADRDMWINAVADQILAHPDQPILVIAQNPEDAHYLLEGLKRIRPGAVALYETSADEHLLTRKLRPGDMIVSTNLGGRGSDYKVDLDHAPKGLHVIVGFDTDEMRIMRQAQGRAGRAGQPGSHQKVFNETLKQKRDPSEIVASLASVMEEDLWCDVYRVFSELVTQLAQDPKTQNEEHRVKRQIMAWLSNPTSHDTTAKILKKAIKAENGEPFARALFTEITTMLRAEPTASTILRDYERGFVESLATLVNKNLVRLHALERVRHPKRFILF